MSQDPGQELLNSGVNFVPTIHNDTYPAIDSSKADLSGKIVFITGASKGIGKASAISYARAGAAVIALGARSKLDNVVSAAKQAAKEAGKKEPKFVTVELDVTDRKSVISAAKTIKDAFGHIDVLVNNAGYLSTFAKFHETNPDEWQKDWDVNIKGLYLVTHTFLPLLLASPSSFKTIINVSSIGALVLGDGASSYQSTKLAVLRLTEFLHQDYGEEGIQTYGVHPGGVKTELGLSLPEQYHAVLNDTPELAGDAFVWLSREERSWLAGRYFNVEWDVDELEGKREEIVKGELLKVRLAVTPFSS